MLWRKRLKKYKEGDEKQLQSDIEKMGGLEKGGACDACSLYIIITKIHSIILYTHGMRILFCVFFNKRARVRIALGRVCGICIELLI